MSTPRPHAAKTPPHTPGLRMKLWVEINGENAFGYGSAALLRGVLDHGSLAGAAKHLNMSYRAAWGRIQKIETRLGRPMLEKRGGNKAGYTLTEHGLAFLNAYEAMDHAVRTVAQQAFGEQFSNLL